MTGDGNLLLGDRQTLANASDSYALAIGELAISPIYATGLNSLANFKLGLGNITTAKTPLYTLDIGGTAGLKTPGTASGSDFLLCWNASTYQITSGCPVSAPDAGMGELGYYAPIELAATNLTTYSNTFSNAVWTRTDANAPTQTVTNLSPDGTADAWSLTTTATGGYLNHSTTSISADSTTVRAFSAWFDESTSTRYDAVLIIYSGGTSVQYFTQYDKNTGIQICTASATCGSYIRTIAGTTWRRIWVAAADANGNNTAINGRIFSNSSIGGAATASIFGAQLEVVPTGTSCAGTDPRCPTSYIPTGSSTQTRNAGSNPCSLGLPTSDPHVLGNIWKDVANDNGCTIKASQG